MFFNFFKSNEAKLNSLLESLISNDIGLLKESIFNINSLEKFKALPISSQNEILIKVTQYKIFFQMLHKKKLQIDSHYVEILKLACPIFNMFIDFKLLTVNNSENIVLHAYGLSGRCLFFSPNFLNCVKYDLLTLIMDPWFELFGRLHDDDLDIYMRATNDYLKLNFKNAVDISNLRVNKIYLEKIPGRPSIISKGFFYFPIFDDNGGFTATLVASQHHEFI